MIYLVYGGSGSGKSEYAENLVMKLNSRKKFYLATMQVSGEEGIERVRRHKALRKGKGFETIERKFLDEAPDLESIVERKSVVLLECLSNLVANEMFQNEKIVDNKTVIEKVCRNLCKLFLIPENVVIVSNNVFEDGFDYSEETKNYMNALGKINQFVAKKADKVFEVVCGIPLEIK